MTLSELSEMMDVKLEIQYLPRRKNRKWICRFDDVEVKGDGVLIGKYGDGDTPGEAMDDYLKSIVGQTLVHSAFRKRREFNIPLTLEA